jgi:autotransporter passenger strand-loop-strand repeat protein
MGTSYSNEVLVGRTLGLHHGDVATGTAVSSGGGMSVNGGTATDTMVNEYGTMFVNDGIVRTVSIASAGTLTVSAGAQVSAATLKAGAKMSIAKGATDTGAKVAGTMSVAGTAKSVTVQNGGVVNAEGKVATATVQKGGKLNVKANGKATGIALQAGGSLAIAKGGTASTKCIASGARIALKAGGTLNLAAGNTLYGAVSFSGATLTGGSTTKRVKLATGAKLSMGAKTNMSKLHLNAGSASLAVAGTGSTLGSVSLNAATQVSYNVSKLVASSTAYMLSLKTASKQCKGKFSITVAKSQGVGVYELSKGIWQKNGASYSIMLGTKNLGVAKVNGLGRVNGNVVYSLASDASHRINLTVAKGAGTAKRGTAGANKLTGGSTWDVFYGGKGNDTISGVNGHDVAVYDKTAWGKDVIASTKGRMTLLFKDLKAGDIVKKLNGSTMTITRNGDSAQSITVKGWSSAKHKIVFGSGMTAFNTFLKAGTVTTAVGKGARNEAWKKAGLAQA